MMQAVTRNPLADPGILGVNAGAYIAVVLAVAIAGTADLSSYVWWSFAGAGLASVIVYVIGSRGRAGRPRSASCSPASRSPPRSRG
jgi:iron complex transport system permease protein